MSDTPVTTWIVDYDLPQGNSRRNFYRRVRNQLLQMGDTGVTGWSTQSVVITDDRDFAELVYEEAVKIGRAHLYKAEKVR
jgi:hypothetical protein